MIDTPEGDGDVKVYCIYGLCTNSDNKKAFNCATKDNYVKCNGFISWVSWTFYLINKKHLGIVKDK